MLGRCVSVAFLFLVASFSLAGVSEAQDDGQPSQESTEDERDERLDERDRLGQQAQKLAAEGKLAEAIAAGERVLALERHIFGDAHAELTGTLEWLSSRYFEQADTKRAEEFAAELLRVREELWGKEDWRTVSARWLLDYVRKLAATEPEKLTKLLAIEAE